MTVHSIRRSRLRLTIALSGAVLAGLGSYAASAKPDSQGTRSAQAGEAAEPAATAKPRLRKPTSKAPAQAETKAETPPTTSAPAPSVAPAANANSAAAQPAQAAPVTVTEPERHARAAKLGRCIDTVTKASSTIDTAHAAVSTWSQKGPDQHMFQSIVALSYSNNVAPKAATVLVAAPEGTGCEATTVQIYPTTRSCTDVEGDLKKAGRTVGDFGGVAMTQEQGAPRHLLLPAPGTGCVVVAVGLALNQ